MKTESGRSLIEVIGVLGITAVMTASAIGIYNSIHQNQKHSIAAATLREVAKDIHTLMGMRGKYDGLSIEYLVKAGALKSELPPIGKTWVIEPGYNSETFVIKISGLTQSDCDFLSVSVPQWATEVSANGHRIDEYAHCFSGIENEVIFIAK